MVDEVRLLSRLVEGVLSHHADVEQNLAFAALDHALVENGQLNKLHQDHEEIDACLRDASLATELNVAVQLLKAGLKASRAHFHQEEQVVFPLFDQIFAPATLETLGAGVSLGISPLGKHGFAKALGERLRNAKNATVPQAKG
jgi:hypothetical protein